MPSRIKAEMASLDEVAGPKVATIFALRTHIAYLVMRNGFEAQRRYRGVSIYVVGSQRIAPPTNIPIP